MGAKQSKIVTKWKQNTTGYAFSSPAREKYLTLCVPLHKAALKGDWTTAENLLSNDPTLTKTRITEGGETALHLAAIEGHVSFVDNLLKKLEKTETEIQNKKGSTALSFAAAAGHVYIAKLLVDKNPKLPTIQGCESVTPLYMAALLGHDEMAEYLFPLSDFELWKKEDQITLLTTSIESELYGLAMSIVEKNNMLVVIEDSNGETPLQVLARKPLAFCESTQLGPWGNITHTISHRYVQAFNLIYELSGVKDLIATYIDTDGNNMLHLAAKLAPQNQLNVIPGAALQMQREVLWYKEVEKIVQPSYRNLRNSNGQTPHDLFLNEHAPLMKEGEKMMKQTAKSCMLVTMLIATVVFTTAFTVPGGYNNSGAPILQNEKMFMVFPISEAIATLSSLTSMLMFLSILTSRYTENEFLDSLPFWLVIGVVALFVSIVAMMVAFCMCLLFYQHGLVAITALLLFFASVPIMFVILKYHLLVTILSCTYGCRWLFRSNNRLFS